jgi:hypothetical protein
MGQDFVADRELKKQGGIGKVYVTLGSNNSPRHVGKPVEGLQTS